MLRDLLYDFQKSVPKLPLSKLMIELFLPYTDNYCYTINEENKYSYGPVNKLNLRKNLQ